VKDGIRDRYRDLGRTLVAPSARARDESATFDREVWRSLAVAGLFRKATLVDRAAALEGLAEGSCDLGLCVSVCAHLVVVAVLERFGTRAQKEHVLPKLVDGTWLGACANAEPGAGTDVMGLKARATRAPGGTEGYAISARKRSVTNLGTADVALVSARLQGVPAREAVNVFLVETSGPRVQMRARTDLAALRTSPTGSLVAWRAPLPEGALVGERGAGVSLFRFMFSEERVTTGFLYLGAIRACLARALKHAEQRKQFGQAIGKNQYVQDKIVKMRVAAELLEAHLLYALARMENGEDVHASLSITKIHGIEAALDAAQDLVRLLGSRGLSVDEPAERLLRDLLGLSILGGTVELQKIVVYNESVRSMSAQKARVEADITSPIVIMGDALIDVVATVDAALEKELVRLVAAAYPDEAGLRGAWYYDTPPDLVVVARRATVIERDSPDQTDDDARLPAAMSAEASVVAAVRTVVVRSVALGERDIVLAGIGAAVRPGHDDAWAPVTARALAEAEKRGADLAVTFLLPGQSEHKLRDAGFDRLRARVTYLGRATGALVDERMPCFVKELRGAALKDEIEARGELHLGVGTW
jgi:alkylation response protein AidB-like acyl-CoA dehydrogenase